MKPYYDDRDYFVPRLMDYETRVLQEIREEQVTYPDLAEYQAGSPHYEALMSQLADAQRFTWPSQLRENV